MSITPDVAEFNALAKKLEESPDHKVLRRFFPVDEYAPPDESVKRLALVFDTETTGLDYQTDEIFEIGFVLAEYNPKTGVVYRVIERYSGFDDPGFPLPDVIVALTGVKTEEIVGKSFDHDRIRAAIAKTDIVIAQNAAFDRKFIEKRYPEFIEKNWACNVVDGPYEAMGMAIKKQEYLAIKVAGIFYDAHRALTDSEVLLDIMTKQGPDGRPILAHILEKAREPNFTVWAIKSDFETKDALKAAGYRWSDGTVPGRPKAWYKETDDVDAELDFLATKIYSRNQMIEVDMVTPLDRYSTRHTERTQMEVRVGARPKP
jgi:DNA polymerase-3 subunit epsilon